MKKRFIITQELDVDDMKDINGGTVKQTLLDILMDVIKGSFAPKM